MISKNLKIYSSKINKKTPIEEEIEKIN